MTSDERPLGVIESITVVRDQCPNGSVRAVAEAALVAVGRDGALVLREQAIFVLAAIKGWRGESARRVHASLTAFVQTDAKS